MPAEPEGQAIIPLVNPMNIAGDLVPNSVLVPNPSINNEEVERQGWFRRNCNKLLIGATALSLSVTLAKDPFDEVKQKVIEAAPWVGTGVIASEALFVAGAVTMAASVGKKVGNPLKLKQNLPEMAKHAGRSKLFKAGFIVNTVGAVGDFVVLSAGVMGKLPVYSWGVLSFTVADLGITVAVRRAMLNSIKKNSLTVGSSGN